MKKKNYEILSRVRFLKYGFNYSVAFKPLISQKKGKKMEWEYTRKGKKNIYRLEESGQITLF